MFYRFLKGESEMVSDVLRRFEDSLQDSAKASARTMVLVGAVGTVVFSIYTVLWLYITPVEHENIELRILAVLGCLGLWSNPRWPVKFKKYLPWYWFFGVSFALPFFSTYQLLASNYSILRSMVEVATAFFVIVLFPHLMLAILNMAIGVGLAIVAAIFTIPDFWELNHGIVGTVHLQAMIYTIGAGLYFTRSNFKGMLAQKKVESLTAFAGSIAHEMRNPLSQVQLCLDSMTKLSAEADQQRAAEVFGPHLIRGQTAIRRGMQIIDMLMRQVKTSDVDASKFELLGAARTTHKAVDEFAYASEAERSKVNVIILHDFVFRGDETAYIFVLFNLIKNALYYFPLKPTATLTLTVDAYSVRVRDTGPGIPANVQARLFESFQTAGKEEGTGLGLSYCRRTMRSFGGDICVHSVEGDYTEFILLFAHEPQQNASVTGVTKPVIAQSRSIEFLSPLTLQGKTVLIAEDDEMNRDMMKMALQKWGMRVVEAAHGEEVLTQLEANAEVDLVIMDLKMPGLDGAEACKRIRSRVCAYQEVPILILSGNADMEGVQADLGAYANGFATKTGDIEQLHAKMLEALRQTK